MTTRRSHVLLRHLRQWTTDADPAPRSDRELLHRFAAGGEEAAFTMLVRRHGPLVLGVCRRVLQQEQDAEDAFQATFLILARKAAAPGWKESIVNWLYRVAHRVAVRARRQGARRLARERRSAVDRRPDDPLAEVTLREAQAVLDDELNRLPERLRAPLVLCCLGGRTRDEAAQKLGWSVATLKRRLEHGREVLAQRLSRRGLTVPAVLAGVTFAEGAASAVVSSALLDATVTAALPARLGFVSAASVSAQTAALVRGTLRAMLLSKLGPALGLVLAAAVVTGLGAALLRQPLPADQPAEADADPPSPPQRSEPNAPRTDRLGDPLPPGARFRLGSLRLRHQGPIHSVAFAAGGSALAAAGDDGVIRLWDPATGKELRHLDGHGAIACSPDGQMLAVLEREAVVLWDVSTGKQLRELRRRTGPPARALVPLVFAPDGRSVAALTGKASATAWEVATGRERVQLPEHEKPIICLGFAPDGKGLLTAVGSRTEDILVRRWDADTGKEVQTARIAAPGPKAWLRPLAFAPDGRTIALEEAAEARRREGAVTNVFTEYRVYLADTATGRELRRLDAEPEVVWAAAFAPDGRRVACQRMDGSIGVWDTATGEKRFVHRGYPGGSRPDGEGTLAFTPDGKTLATAGDSGAVHVWDVATGREVAANAEAHHADVTCVAYSPRGELMATGSNDHTICLWDTGTGRQRLRLAGHPSGVRALVFSPDGHTLASAGGDQTIRLWDPATGKERLTFKEERKSRSSYTNYGVHALGFLLDGRTLVSWGEDQMLRTWDLAAGKERSSKQIPLRGLSGTAPSEPGEPLAALLADHVTWAAFTPDGATIVLASEKAVHLVETAGGKEVFQIPDTPRLACLALSADGQTLVIGCSDRSVRLIEMATGKEALRVTLPHGPEQAAFAPDGRSVAVAGGRGMIHVLDVSTGKERAVLKAPQTSVRSLAFQPDGRVLATGLSDTTALLWDVPAASPRSPQKELSAADRDDLWAALGGDDATKAHAALATLAAHPGPAVALLGERLCAAPPVDPRHVQALVADLDHKEFAQREKASQELKKLGAAAEAALRAALAGNPSVETRRRIEMILETPPPWAPPDADALRRTRAIQVLERIGSPAAAAILEKLAGGAATARETDLAQAARRRLSERVP